MSEETSKCVSYFVRIFGIFFFTISVLCIFVGVYTCYWQFIIGSSIMAYVYSLLLHGTFNRDLDSLNDFLIIGAIKSLGLVALSGYWVYLTFHDANEAYEPVYEAKVTFAVLLATSFYLVFYAMVCIFYNDVKAESENNK